MHKEQVIIAGGGLSGLSLAQSLAPLVKNITIVDKEEKRGNDRTWCFWTRTPERYSTLTTHSWKKIKIAHPQAQTILDLEPYTYCLIRSKEWYDNAWNHLARYNSVSTITSNINSIDAEKGVVSTDQGDYKGDLIFSSIFDYKNLKKFKQNETLLQHFLGWWIETPHPSFDPEVATFMDFRTSQKQGLSFFYVLPVSSTRALIECTYISENIADASVYTQAINTYIINILGLDEFVTTEEEKGVIPMTDFLFQPVSQKKLVAIGTAGGFVKPSSGFAFTRTEKKIDKIIQAIKKGDVTSLNRVSFNDRKFGLYDSTLLYALRNNVIDGSTFFYSLLTQNPLTTILRFLDEETSIIQDLTIMYKHTYLVRPFLHKLLH